MTKKAEQIPKIDAPFQVIPLHGDGPSKPSPSSGIHELLGIGTAIADDKVITRGPWANWGAVQLEETNYSVFFKATDANDARQLAIKLKVNYPEVQAIKTNTGFGVITPAKPESTAVPDAIKFKKESGLQPQLILMSK